MSDMPEMIRWEIGVPIVKNTVIVRQLGLAIGIPFGLIALVIAFVSGRNRDTLYALGFIAGLLLLTGLFVMAVYRGKYEVEFVLDQRGVLCRTQAKQAKKSRIINTLAVIFGLLSGRPAVAGAGMLAQSRQEVFLRWNHITKVKYEPKSRTILLRGGWTEQIGVFCKAENYIQVEDMIRRKISLPKRGVDR